MIEFPALSRAKRFRSFGNRLYIGAFGFEPRSLGWAMSQNTDKRVLDTALVFHYSKPKGRNFVKPLKCALEKASSGHMKIVPHDVWLPHDTERMVDEKLQKVLTEIGEVVVDISAMTKLLILITFSKLTDFKGTVRIVYTQAKQYAPTEEEYEKSKLEMALIAKYPSRGFETVIRTKSLSSIRMQGQPISLIAFTSFNEQLVRHMLGSITPHRLFLINGRPPSPESAWREKATQEIHRQLIEEYQSDNPIGNDGLLSRVASTLEYRETIDRINEIYREVGSYERIICAATGSKMQTVGLFFSKVIHPDIHIEYPTPDSYFVKRMSEGIEKVNEVVIPDFASFIDELRDGKR